MKLYSFAFSPRWVFRPRRNKLTGKLHRNQRGQSMVSYAITLPIFLLLVIGGMQVFRILAIRTSLELATYQTSRIISSNSKEYSFYNHDPQEWRDKALAEARDRVKNEMQKNPLASPTNYSVDVSVPANIDCDDRTAGVQDRAFLVRSVVTIPGPFGIPFIVTPGQIQMQITRVGFQECGIAPGIILPDNHAY
ncbi:MAG: pilus assembly protein [Chloroflexi bacterium]|nr:pilus assembly protein [Chloroflexota bacterium]